MNLEFVTSIILGFGISGAIALFLRITGYFIHKISIEEDMSNDGLLDSNEDDFDRIIIDQTNIRIQEELSNLSADELKASVIVGVVPAIFGILSAVSHSIFIHILKTPNWHDLLLVIPFSFLIISFVCAFKVIFPRIRFNLWDPRDSNDEYSSLNIKDIHRKLKEERIKDFEEIRNARDKDATNLKIGYVLLIIGSLSLLAIITIIDPSSNQISL